MRRVLVLGFVAALAIACSSSSSSDGTSGGAGGDGGAGDGGDGGNAACSGDCSAITLAAAFGDAGTGPFDRAFFGTQTLSTGLAIHVSAREGGTPNCPTDGSTPPTRNLEVTGIPAQIPVASSADSSQGVHASFTEGNGGLGTIAKSTAVTVTLTAIDSAKDPQWLALDVDATFPTGTVKGHLYAVFCASLSN